MKYTLTFLLALAALAGSLLSAQNCRALTGEPGSDSGFVELLGPVVSEEELVLESGGQATEIEKVYMTLNSSSMSADVEGNVLDSGATGMNLIGSGTLAEMNGFSTVIQNSGNQCVIQSDLIVNVNMH